MEATSKSVILHTPCSKSAKMAQITQGDVAVKDAQLAGADTTTAHQPDSSTKSLHEASSSRTETVPHGKRTPKASKDRAMTKDDDYQQIRRHKKLKKMKCENTGNLLVKPKSGQKEARKRVVCGKNFQLQKPKARRADTVSRRKRFRRVLAKGFLEDKWVFLKMKFERNAHAKHWQLQSRGQAALSMEATSKSVILHTPCSRSAKMAQIAQGDVTVKDAQLAGADTTTAHQPDSSTKSLHEASSSCTETVPQVKRTPKTSKDKAMTKDENFQQIRRHKKLKKLKCENTSNSLVKSKICQKGARKRVVCGKHFLLQKPKARRADTVSRRRLRRVLAKSFLKDKWVFLKRKFERNAHAKCRQLQPRGQAALSMEPTSKSVILHTPCSRSAKMAQITQGDVTVKDAQLAGADTTTAHQPDSSTKSLHEASSSRTETVPHGKRTPKASKDRAMTKDDDYQQIRRHKKLKKMKCENTGNLLLQKPKARRADTVSRRKRFRRVLAKGFLEDKWVFLKMKFERNAHAKHQQLQSRGQAALSMEATSKSVILHTPCSRSAKMAQIAQGDVTVKDAQLAGADTTTAHQPDSSTKSLHEASSSCTETVPQVKRTPKASKDRAMTKDDDYQQIRRHQKLKKMKCENTGNLLVKPKSGQKEARKRVVCGKNFQLQKPKARRADTVSRRKRFRRVLAKGFLEDKWVFLKMKFERNAHAKHQQLQSRGQAALSMEATSKSVILHTPCSRSAKMAQIAQGDVTVEHAQLGGADTTTAHQSDSSTKSLHEASSSRTETVPDQVKRTPKAKKPSQHQLHSSMPRHARLMMYFYATWHATISKSLAVKRQQQTFDNVRVSLPCFTGKAAEWKQCIKHVRNWAFHMTLKEPLSDKLLHYITWEIVLFLLILMLCAWTFAKTLVSFLQRISSNSAGQGWLRILTLLLPGQCEEDRYNEQECADSVEPSEDNLGGIYGEDIAHPPILVAGAAGGDDGDRNNRRDRNYRDDRIHPEENGIEEVDNNELPVECTEGNDDTTNTEVTPEPAIGGVDDEFERATNLDIAGAHYAAIPEAIEDIAQQAVDEQAPMEYDVMAQPAENNLLFGYGEPCSDEEEIRQDTIVHFPDDQD
ncbi:hypothetical protein EB796_019519 [Bugula neritina]|uniref:Uncharacterized protein n=1 Tax=Bugula neritina TaxID=10212 RepID=A0A7J7J827_BUGNE|nr:hypothetical protein EB796_019519 [Bugula neritina]